MNTSQLPPGILPDNLQSDFSDLPSKLPSKLKDVNTTEMIVGQQLESGIVDMHTKLENASKKMFMGLLATMGVLFFMYLVLSFGSRPKFMSMLIDSKKKFILAIVPSVALMAILFLFIHVVSSELPEDL